MDGKNENGRTEKKNWNVDEKQNKKKTKKL